MKHLHFFKQCICLLLSVLLAAGTLVSISGAAYAEAHPQAVNQGKTAAEVEQEDMAVFSERTGYDYHDAEEDDYAPNEVIIEISSSPSSQTAALRSMEDDYGLSMIKVLEASEIGSTAEPSASSLSYGSGIVTTYLMYSERDDILSVCDELNELDAVRYAQPNFRYEACDVPEEVNMSPVEEEVDTIASYTAPRALSTDFYKEKLKWWFEYCGISTFWESYADSSTGYGMGSGVKVAVIDSGCNTAHKDIKNNLFTISGTTKCGYYAYGGTNNQGEYILKDDPTNDTSGHGSHVCGTIAMDGTNAVGGIGVAPKCKLIVMKADRPTSAGSFFTSEIKISLQKATSSEFAADIINMSLGGYNFDYSLYQSYQLASSKALIICAAGNDSFDTTEKIHFPSAASCVMGVMATSSSTTRGDLAYFSNYDTTGIFYKVAAPGTNIYSLKASTNDDYCSLNGTSMATPVVSGMAACYMSYIKNVKQWNWTPAQYQYKIESIIASTLNNNTITPIKNHPVAQANDSKFYLMNLSFLNSKSTYNSFSSTSKPSFANTKIKNAVKAATGYEDSELDTYALKRVSLLVWSNDSDRKALSDFSDFQYLTGLNYFDISGSSKVTQSNLATVISYLPETIVHLNLTVNAKLTDISCLNNAKFPMLHYLNISSNSITSLSAIQHFTSLKELYASYNDIMDISPLLSLTHLQKLDIDNNEIEDATGAFASVFANYIDLSYNKLTDHNQLWNYKGAFYNTENKSDTITINVSHNNITGLTQTLADSYIDFIKNNNTKSGVEYAKTITFEWSGQTSPTVSIPMTSFSIADNVVSRDQLCAGNLNLNSITNFTAYPSNANKYNYLTWTCSEEGYFAADGTVLVKPEEITSCRTLTLTGTSPAASGATSTEDNQSTSQTIKLTITAPEIYNACLSQNVIQTGSAATFLVVVNKYTTKLVLKSGLTASATHYGMYNCSSMTTVGSGECKVGLFSLPASCLQTAGNYPFYLFAVDSSGYYASSYSNDISGIKSYPYRSLGTLYVKDSVDTADTYNIKLPATMNRRGEALMFTTNSGTSSTSPAKPSGETLLTTYISYKPYYGGSGVYKAYGCGYFGGDYSGYPNETTKTCPFFLQNANATGLSDGILTAGFTTVGPKVTDVSVRNGSSVRTDGYIEYLVKTNTDATSLVTYTYGTTDIVDTDYNHLATTFSNSSYAYGEYNANYSCKLWSLKVPLTKSKAIQTITIAAADELGVGTETKTPASTVQLSGTQYFYPGEPTAKDYAQFVKILPLNSDGTSAADCCNEVSFSAPITDYFSMTGSYINCNMTNVLADLEGTDSESRSTGITVKLPNGNSSTAYVYAYRPIISNLTYNTATSQIQKNGTIYYSVKTYGADRITVHNTETGSAVMTLTKSGTAEYTEQTDSKGNVYTIWNFQRKFTGTNLTISTYVRAGYRVSSSLTAHSKNTLPKTITRALESADYSAWNAQCERISDSVLEQLQALYGSAQADVYAQRLEAYQAFLDEAVLDYDETQQTACNTQTANFKPYVDALLGYGDYNQALSDFEALANSNNLKYIPASLCELVESDVNDQNCKLLANQIQAGIADVNALADAVNEVYNYLSDLRRTIPELETQTETPIEYGAESYTALRNMYFSVKDGIAQNTYASAAELNDDYAELQRLFAVLHEHEFTSAIVPATCTEQGYTTYTCSLCGESYTDNYTESLGHLPLVLEAVEPTCTDTGLTAGEKCARCDTVLFAQETIPMLGHDFGEWRLTTAATCTETGVQTRVCSRNAEHTETREVEALDHNYSRSIIDPTCNEHGYTIYSCTRCESGYIADYTDARGHDYEFISVEPSDKTSGYTAYRCKACQAVFAAVYENNSFAPASEVDSLEQAQQQAALPAPSFNSFTDESCDYSDHSGSLRVSEGIEFTDINTTQGLRFAGSIEVPEGVDYRVGAADNAVIDFGFVYSQSALIDSDIRQLVIDGKNVYAMSVLQRNSGAESFEQWKGVTYHSQDNTLTFNIVINVKSYNWTKDYCARAYVTYRYHGLTFTVYDSDFSSRNVVEIAEQVLANPAESAEAKALCQNKILNNI